MRRGDRRVSDFGAPRRRDLCNGRSFETGKVRLHSSHSPSCNHYHPDCLHLPHSRPCPAVSSHSNCRFLRCVQFSTDRKHTPARDPQPAQDEVEGRNAFVLLRKIPCYYAVTHLLRGFVEWIVKFTILHNSAIFEREKNRHRNEFFGAPKVWGTRPWLMRKTVPIQFRKRKPGPEPPLEPAHTQQVTGLKKN